jgi:ABC-type antimicrobial peptide transport system permease subunit
MPSQALTAQIEQSLSRLDSRALPGEVASIDTMMWGAIAKERFTMVLVATFACCTLLLSAVGLYSVIARNVHHRRREHALRLCLGSSVGAILLRVLGGGVLLTAAGLGLGLLLASAMSRFASQILAIQTEVSFYFSAAAVVLMAVVMAMVRPARLAIRLDLTSVLRGEQ